ncbi:glycosylphosphatidylinositol transamidase [Kwoniella mangroviensis CBS 10435]|uniref:Glycosylphosphatidylinositol transamidase n=1 Tax=Kwoniella mangroviensis CBS 10435 TaxID=1331196 RepID=A0A1B9IZ94_9TREE|nr:glycosylphosphatidylinositol transamidase [Kwoniella mangroviensis CBS 10435]
MLSRIRRRNAGPRPDPKSVNFASEHLTVSKTIARRKKVLGVIWEKIPLIRAILATAGFLWLFAIPYEGLWKGTYVDEHALQPGQVTTYFDWGNVHKADLYLDKLERIVNGTFEERSAYLQDTFSSSGLSTSNASTSIYAHVKPPRSKGTESILVSANWVSRDGTPNLRGVATLLAMGDFLKGQNHWAFDFILVVGEGYMEGLEGFMREYSTLFNGVIWTGLNIDYPGHSFSHIGLFYEGVNGRLPNQDILNTISRVAQFTGGVPTRYHNIPDEVPSIGPEWLGKYLLASKHLLSHFGYMITGRASAAHGVLARHRIDSLTLYCTPSEGPHGFHTLGRTLESSLRSLNNLLERLHASYFFYLLPRPWNFIPIGHYLPSAILLSASITIGGFDIPNPLEALVYVLFGFIASFVFWIASCHPIAWYSFFIGPLTLKLQRQLRGGNVNQIKASRELLRSIKGLLRLLYGSLIATLSMINFPQSIFLALISLLYLTDFPKSIKYLILVVSQPGLVLWLLKYSLDVDLDLAKDWLELGNLTYPLGVYGIWGSLWINSVLLLKDE